MCGVCDGFVVLFVMVNVTTIGLGLPVFGCGLFKRTDINVITNVAVVQVRYSIERP